MRIAGSRRAAGCPPRWGAGRVEGCRAGRCTRGLRRAGFLAPLSAVRCPLTGLPDSVPPGVDLDEDREWDRDELSLAQSIGGFEAGRRLSTAVALRDRLPGAAAALAAGVISWRHADAVDRATQALDIESAQLVERRLLADRRAVTVTQ